MRRLHVRCLPGLPAPGRFAATLLIALMATGLLTARVDAEDKSLKESAKEAGHAVGSAAHDVGQGAKNAGKEIGHAPKKVGQAVGHTAKQGVEAVKEGGRELKHAVTGDK